MPRRGFCGKSQAQCSAALGRLSQTLGHQDNNDHEEESGRLQNRNGWRLVACRNTGTPYLLIQTNTYGVPVFFLIENNRGQTTVFIGQVNQNKRGQSEIKYFDRRVAPLFCMIH
jgi:hypothetical protein